MKNSLLDFDIDYDILESFDNDMLYEYNIMPLYKEQLFVIVATSKEQKDIDQLVDIFKQPIKLISLEHTELQFEWKHLGLKKKLYNLGQKAINYNNQSNNSYILEFIDEILHFSIKNNVSDIHFECFENSVVLRCRIDGVLNQFFRFHITLYQVISSTIKYLGNLDLAQKRIPLNSRVTRTVESINYDIRISTMPTIHGESIVLRILDNGNIDKNLQDIGFEQNTLEAIESILTLTQGLVLVTGPTGSGKTTTLYSMLNEINTKEKKIITIEDPVEYKLDGVVQVNLNPDIDLDYPTVLKNVLRQDPDILLIGEIRDIESLQIAIQASLTGHLVIATLHTNNAIETITRLLDLNAPSYLIAATLKMVISQRLLRLLCENCKEQSGDSTYTSVGCKECNFTGYKDRQVVSEVLNIDGEIAKLISEYKDLSKIEDYLETKNFNSLSTNGKKLLNDGKTSYSEFCSKL
jgi:general secretion pathway protein E